MKQRLLLASLVTALAANTLIASPGAHNPRGPAQERIGGQMSGEVERGSTESPSTAPQDAASAAPQPGDPNL